MTESQIREIVRDELAKIEAERIAGDKEWAEMQRQANLFGKLPPDNVLWSLPMERVCQLQRLKTNWDFSPEGGLRGVLRGSLTPPIGGSEE